MANVDPPVVVVGRVGCLDLIGNLYLEITQTPLPRQDEERKEGGEKGESAEGREKPEKKRRERERRGRR